MANVFINGVKANAGGGKCILKNYLALLKDNDNKHKYFVLTPDKKEYLEYTCDFIEIVDINNLYKKNALFPLLYYWGLPKLFKKLKIDIIFNFGDMIIPTKIAQIYMFDWPYAVYPESLIWQKMSCNNYLARKLKLILIKKYIKYPVIVIGQTKTICNRLKRCFGLTKVEIIPSAVPLENLDKGEYFDFCLPKDKFKLLYPSSWAPHKNLEVLIPLAKKIKEHSYPYVIIVTIETKNNKFAQNFLDEIETELLASVILNVGQIEMKNIPSLYQQSDALLMPTLLETYGLPYIEAMYHKKTILTSDLDFAHDVCGDAAFYFDPLDENSILETIKKAYSDIDGRYLKISEGDSKIKQLLTWEQVFEHYQNLLELNIRKLEKAI